jgi:hypothetical protein
MIKNMGTIDRIIRMFITVLLAVLVFTGVVHGAGMIVSSVIGFYLLVTAIFSFCPLYTLVGIHTLRTKSGVDD